MSKKFAWIATLVVILTLVVPWAAFADNTVPDGDGTTPVVQTDLALGTVCTGTTVTGSVLVAIKRNGGYPSKNVFLNGTTVTVSVYGFTGTGLSAAMSASPSTIVLPSGWGDLDNKTMSDYVTSNVTFVAGNAPRSLAGTITFRSQGLSSKEPKQGEARATVDDRTAINVTATVISCNTPPTITVNDVTLEGNTSGGRTLVFSDIGSASDAEGSVSVSCAPAIGSVLPLDTTTVSCTATDSTGATKSDSGNVTVVDTVGPTLQNVPSSDYFEGDTAGGKVYTYTPPTATDVVWGAVSVSCVPAPGSLFALGVTTVTCTATDGSLNSSSDGFAVTVNDTIWPELQGMPEDMEVEENTLGGAIVSFTAPTATDIVDPHPTITCDHDPTDDFYPLGRTTVFCTAADAAGNTTVGLFVITVVDTQAPVFSAVSDVNIEGNTTGGANVSFTAPTAADVVWGATDVTCSASSGAFFPLGANLVTCATTDGSGNPATVSFNVTVVDTTAPMLVNMPSDIQIEGNMTGGAL